MNRELDLSYSFDENLHEVANNPHDIKLHIANLLSEQDCSNSLSEIGVYYRIIKELDKSLHYLNLAKSKGATGIPFKIRLAHTYQWMKNFEMSNQIFDELIFNMDGVTNPMKAFIHQHRGKNLFDQGLYVNALMEFDKAYDIRLKNNSPIDQIESTQMAIRETLKRLS